ncbi:two-component system sensor histidine kinase/response regulator, partial [Mycolicibacterium sp. P1-5]
MKLATRLAIVCGCALLAVILANTLYTVQINHINALFESRNAAREDQVGAIAVQRDLQALLVAHDRLVFTTDPARRAELNSELDQLDKAVDTELRAGAEDEATGTIRLQYQQALSNWNSFRLSYRAEVQNPQNPGQAAATARDLGNQVAPLETQLRQIEQDAVSAVDRANQRAGQAISFARTVLWILASAIVLVLGILLYFTSRNIHRTVTRAAEQNEKARRSKEIQANLMTEVQAAPDLASAGSIIVSRTAQALDAKHGALYLRQ